MCDNFTVDLWGAPSHTCDIVTRRVAPGFRGTLMSFAVPALAVVLACFIGLAALPRDRADAAELRPWAGRLPLKFTLPAATDDTVALEAKRGQVVLVHFFATWCEPCRKELPALNRLSARGGDRVKVVAISVAEVDLQARRFLDSTPVDFPVLLDRDRAVAKAWNASTLPTTVILDTKLHPQLVVETEFAWDTLDPAGLVAMTSAVPAHLKSESITKAVKQGG